MPYDSQGIASVAGNRPVNGQDTDAAQINVPLADIQAMLSQVLLKSGVAPMLGNLNMNGFKIGNLAEATNPEDAVLKSQLDESISGLSISNAKTVTVGASGDFTTLTEAIASVSKIFKVPYVKSGLRVQIRLLAGFVMSEQILLSGIDLSYITIVSDASIVYVDPAAIVTSLAGSDSGEPVFGAIASAKLPRIGVQFEYLTQQTGTKAGVAVFGGSSVEFLPGSGVRKAARGLAVYHGSWAFCTIPGYRSVDSVLPGVYSVDFSNTQGRALDVQHGSSVVLPRSIFDDSGTTSDPSVYGIWDARLDLTQHKTRRSRCTSSAGGAVRVRDNSYICAREGDVSASAGHGYYFSHTVVADLRHKSDGGATNAQSARNCGRSGLFADGGCIIDAAEFVATGCQELITGGNTNGAVEVNGGSVHLDLCDVSNSAQRGIVARNASIVSAQEGKANNCANGAIQSLRGSTINFGAGSAINCGGVAIYAHQGGRIHFEDGIATGATDEGCRAQRGSYISAYNANFRKGALDSVTDIVCIQGSTISAPTSIGGVNTPTNTVSVNGVIYK